MRVVLDTNVLVSGVFFTGAPFEILPAWRRGRFQLCISPEIILEYDAVMRRLRHELTGADALDVLALIVGHAVVVDPPPLEAPVSAAALRDLLDEVPDVEPDARSDCLTRANR